MSHREATIAGCERISRSVSTRLLFVDDEDAIRATLAAILQQEGFEVGVAASVPEALELINHQSFDVLLTDLNIGGPGDGFVLVSAMRRVQPSAVTLILTGYPDFETALEAIRKQVDDYLTKPADIPTLVAAIKERLRNPRRIRERPSKRVSAVIQENTDRITQQWLAAAKSNEKLNAIPISDHERIHHLPALLTLLSETLECEDSETLKDAFRAAIKHGESRARQGYRISQIMLETRILNKVISATLQENLLILDLSSVIADVLRMGENLNGLVEESIHAYERTQRLGQTLPKLHLNLFGPRRQSG